MARPREIVMLGPSLSSKGGIASVVKAYQQLGLFDRYPITFIATHVEGSRVIKLCRRGAAFVELAFMLLLRRVCVVHVHVARWNSFWRKSLFFMLARVFNIPYIVHIHSGGFPDFYERDCSPVAKRVIRSFLNRAAKLVVLTSPVAIWLDYISKNKNIFQIPNFIDTNIPPRVGNSLKSKRILFLGRLTEEKGVFDLLDAAAILQRRGIDFELVLAGDGDRKAVTRTIESLGLVGCVNLPGWLVGSAKLDMLLSAQIFVLPSYVEGLPMGILEAMAAGCPIVAARVGGVPEQVEDLVSAVLIEAGDVSELASALNKLLVDVELCQQYGAAAKLRVKEKFSPEAMFPLMAELYEPYLER